MCAPDLSRGRRSAASFCASTGTGGSLILQRLQVVARGDCGGPNCAVEPAIADYRSFVTDRVIRTPVAAVSWSSRCA